MFIESIKNHLKTWFDYPNNKVFCQVSTINGKNPHIRTMDLYHITDDGQLIFTTDTHSKKWLDLKACQNAAVCILHQDRGQIIVEGKARLKTSATDLETTSYYWQNYLDQYWRDYYLSRVPNQATQDIPKSFGIIALKPQYGEILEINSEDFLQSSRKKFQLVKNIWSMREVACE